MQEKRIKREEIRLHCKLIKKHQLPMDVTDSKREQSDEFAREGMFQK